jgi:hypothetical protein
MKSFLIAVAMLFAGSSVVFAGEVTDEAICYAAGIGAGNISNYKERYFDENPQETMRILVNAKSHLQSIPAFYRKKVDMSVIDKASPRSWTSVQAALSEFNNICPCGGQSPCGFGGPPISIEKVKP